MRNKFIEKHLKNGAKAVHFAMTEICQEQKAPHWNSHKSGQEQQWEHSWKGYVVCDTSLVTLLVWMQNKEF
jgi:hypothetical protein